MRKNSKKSSKNIGLEAKLGYFNPIRAKNFHKPQHFSLDKQLGAYLGLRKHVVIYCHFIMLSNIL